MKVLCSKVFNILERNLFNKDFILAVFIFLLSMIIAIFTYMNYRYKRQFYQREFLPAVRMACDGNFASMPSKFISKELKDFLNTNNTGKKEFKCRSMKWNKIPVVKKFNGLQSRSTVLLVMSGMLWKVFGIKWGVLSIVAGLFYGLFGSSFYLIARSFVSKFFAFIFSIMFILNTEVLFYIPHLRDFSKAPFILAFLSVLLFFTNKKFSWSAKNILSGIMGVIIAIGLGFRQDMILLFPLFFLGVLINNYPKEKSFLKNIVLKKCVTVFIFIAFFYVFSLPFLANGYLKKSSGSGHNMILGQTEPLNKNFEFKEKIYSVGHTYNDSFTGDLMEFYGNMHGVENAKWPNSLSDEMGVKYQIDLLKLFPFDHFKKVIYSMKHTMSYGLKMRNKSFFIFKLDHLGFYLFVVASTLLLFIGSLNKFLIFSFSSIYFAASTIILFQKRHYFYLTYVPYLSGSIILYYAYLFISNIRGDIAKYFVVKNLRSKIVFIFLFLIITYSSFKFLNFFQTKNLLITFNNWDNAKGVKLDIDVSKGSENKFWGGEYYKFELHDKLKKHKYLFALFDSSKCEQNIKKFEFLTYYDLKESSRKYNPYSKLCKIPKEVISKNDFKVYFPVFFSKKNVYSFSGIYLPKNLKNCFKGLYEINDYSKVNLPIFLVLPYNWKDVVLNKGSILSEDRYKYTIN